MSDHNQEFFEPHATDVNSKLNWLRAGVLGANDGIVSVAGLLMGVAAAGAGSKELMTAGIASVASGAVSMALGEYVSVSAQRDTERQLVAKEKWELESFPDQEHAELVGILKEKGMSAETAEIAATEMESQNALAAHLDMELGMDAEELTNPWVAAGSSAVSFVVGAMIPFLCAIFAPAQARVWVILLGTVVALTLTGGLSAKFSESSTGRSVTRLVVGGALALGVTYLIGWLFGVSVA
ncbi:VIT1/CCC1 transporter family protein [Corynebacterium hindlerae]|uniref:VIT1/CCC1 transporter family protein n=1 Tax=Corynebacterium hindlerae TaxID=699041 RepID=UPI001AD660EF|nr:VIT family protein [Corynebacterium hindlerae]QTH59464.1 VIT family protein [Corynebacterium hindlerae]